MAGGTTGAGEGNLLVSDKEPGPELELALLSGRLWREMAAEPGLGTAHMFMGHVAGGSYHQQKWYGQYVDGTAPTEGWHTYGLEWRNGYVAYYVDGVKHHEVTDGVSNEQMYIILNSGVAAYAKHGGPPDATNTWPADFEVDYVRVYAEDGSPATRR